MSNYEKYLKYKKKYLELKDRERGLVGGSLMPNGSGVSGDRSTSGRTQSSQYAHDQQRLNEEKERARAELMAARERHNKIKEMEKQRQHMGSSRPGSQQLIGGENDLPKGSQDQGRDMRRESKRSQEIRRGERSSRDKESDKRSEAQRRRRLEIHGGESGRQYYERSIDRQYDRERKLVGNDGRGRQRGGAYPFALEDEIWFWSTQITEHTLILHLGLEEPDPTQELKLGLKQQALELHNLWKQFMLNTFWSKGVGIDPVPLFKEDLAQTLNKTESNSQKVTQMNQQTDIFKPLDKYFLTDQEVRLVRGQINTNILAELLQQTISFKQEIVNILNKNVWIGWIFPSLALHILKEAQYFQRKISGPQFTPKEEIEFINQHHMEEIGVTAQLIDPAPENNALIEKARSFVNGKLDNLTEEDLQVLRGMTPGEQATLLNVSIKYSKELCKFAEESGKHIDMKHVKTIINPLLAHHIFREFARFTKTLESLQHLQNNPQLLQNQTQVQVQTSQ